MAATRYRILDLLNIMSLILFQQTKNDKQLKHELAEHFQNPQLTKMPHHGRTGKANPAAHLTTAPFTHTKELRKDYRLVEISKVANIKKPVKDFDTYLRALKYRIHYINF